MFLARVTENSVVMIDDQTGHVIFSRKNNLILDCVGTGAMRSLPPTHRRPSIRIGSSLYKRLVFLTSFSGWVTSSGKAQHCTFLKISFSAFLISSRVMYFGVLRGSLSPLLARKRLSL